MSNYHPRNTQIITQLHSTLFPLDILWNTMKTYRILQERIYKKSIENRPIEILQVLNLQESLQAYNTSKNATKHDYFKSKYENQKQLFLSIFQVFYDNFPFFRTRIPYFIGKFCGKNSNELWPPMFDFASHLWEIIDNNNNKQLKKKAFKHIIGGFLVDKMKDSIRSKPSLFQLDRYRKEISKNMCVIPSS